MVTTETDLVIRTIRESRDPDEARERLMKLPLKGLEEFVRRAGQTPDPERAGDYFLSERQAKAILEMRLSKLTGLEQEKLAEEYRELCEVIAHLSGILADEGKLMALIVEELTELQQKYGEDRRTEIVDNEAEIQIEDLIQCFHQVEGQPLPHLHRDVFNQLFLVSFRQDDRLHPVASRAKHLLLDAADRQYATGERHLARHCQV